MHISSAVFQAYAQLFCVLNLNTAYNGQKRMMAVRTNTAASTNKTIPRAPLTIPAKYRYANRAATATRTIRSILERLGFIRESPLVVWFDVCIVGDSVLYVCDKVTQQHGRLIPQNPKFPPSPAPLPPFLFERNLPEFG